MNAEQVQHAVDYAVSCAKSEILGTWAVILFHARERVKLAGDDKVAHLLTDVLNIMLDGAGDHLRRANKKTSELLDRR